MTDPPAVIHPLALSRATGRAGPVVGEYSVDGDVFAVTCRLEVGFERVDGEPEEVIASVQWICLSSSATPQLPNATGGVQLSATAPQPDESVTVSCQDDVGANLGASCATSPVEYTSLDFPDSSPEPWGVTATSLATLEVALLDPGDEDFEWKTSSEGCNIQSLAASCRTSSEFPQGLGGDMPPFLECPPSNASSACVDDWEPVEEQLGDFEPELLQAVGASRYGGMWIDRAGAQSVLRVAVVNGTSDDEVALRNAVEIDPTLLGERLFIWTLAVDDSFEELSACREALASMDPTLGERFVALSVDVQLNSVEYMSAAVNPDRLNEALDSGSCSLDMIMWRPGLAQSRHLGSWSSQIPPYHAALYTRYVWGNAPSSCTTAFSARIEGGTAGYGLSAGHCSPSGAPVHTYNGMQMSTVNRSTRYDQDAISDSLRFPMSGTLERRIYYVPNTHRTVVAPKFSWGQLFPEEQFGVPNGLRVCFYGVFSNQYRSNAESCGHITVANAYFAYDPDELDDNDEYQWQFATCFLPEYPSVPGDSGAPVYHVKTTGRARPAGVFNFSLLETGEECFSAIGHVELDMDVVVLCKEDLGANGVGNDVDC